VSGETAPPARIVTRGGMTALPRLAKALAARGHEVRGDGDPAGGTLIVAPWSGDALGADAARAARILVLTWIGAHPDARDPGLRGQWDCEERARALGVPVLVLRLAPLVGPTSPFWSALCAGLPLPGGGRALLRPVVEDDVVEAADRALSGAAAWDGWFEACGPAVTTLAEAAARARPGGRSGPGAFWEPPPAVLLEQRLPEPGPWSAHFGIAPADPLERAAAWAA